MPICGFCNEYVPNYACEQCQNCKKYICYTCWNKRHHPVNMIDMDPVSFCKDCFRKLQDSFNNKQIRYW